LRDGTDITVVGDQSQHCAGSRETLAWIYVIEVQTLLPFDINHSIAASLKKNNHIIDEDVPGAYMFNKVYEEQKGYKF
jgi:pyruvate/2-oxoglutarate/acetoin dehydrogenase E1 component